MRGFIEKVKEMQATKPASFRALVTLLGCEVLVLILFFLFAGLVLVAWLLLRPVLWP